MKGGNGVAKNLEEAKKWYEQAAALGNEDARANMKRVKEKMKKAIGIPLPGMPSAWRTVVFHSRPRTETENSVFHAESPLTAPVR